jgi:hypothetical protein
MVTPTPTTAADPIAPTDPNTDKGDLPSQTLHGLKLATLLGSITLVTFLALIDTSILGTVRPLPPSSPSTNNPRPYPR